MPLRVVVDADNGVAPWRQVYDQIVRAITTGALAHGARLPPIRQLARDLGLASGTIARVYRELEAGGQVATGRAKGTVVTGPAEQPNRAELLRKAAAEFAVRAYELNAGPAEAVDAVRTALDEIPAERGS
jgi:DNA-binding transcriptional regulator YhcF (GntR family)